jgi:hypothetical protein
MGRARPLSGSYGDAPEDVIIRKRQDTVALTHSEMSIAVIAAAEFLTHWRHCEANAVTPRRHWVVLGAPQQASNGPPVMFHRRHHLSSREHDRHHDHHRRYHHDGLTITIDIDDGVVPS